MIQIMKCKQLKRTLSIFLALLTVISVVAIGAGSISASGASINRLTNGTFYYSVWKNKVYLNRVVDMDYTGKTLVIPAEIDGMEVAGIGGDGHSLFLYMADSKNIDTITSIKIEEGIVQLMNGKYNNPDYEGDREFDEEDLGVVGVFERLKNLKNVSLPKSLKAIDFGMFRNCSSLEKITIPESVEYFGTNVFDGCTSLKYVNLPSNMKNIPKKMFRNCKSLKSITIPSSVKSIDESAFAYCESLKFKIPKNIKVIGEKAFYSCKSLTGKLKIPKNLKEIGDGAFAFCTGLTGFRIADENKYFSQKGGVLFNKKKTEIHCYLSGKETKEYKVPSTVKSIDDYAFAGTKHLRKITLSNKMKIVSGYAFYKSKVKEVNMPKSIVDIRDSAFEKCKNLKEIKIPSKVKSIGAFVFKGCDKLKSLTFPKSVSTISLEAFDNCKNLKTVKILNKKCDIYFWKDKVSGSKPTIYGYKNSTAQKFAKEAKLKFVTIK